MEQDVAIRESAIRHCRLLSPTWGEAVPWQALQRGFLIDGQSVKLVGMQGVFKPKELHDGPLTLLSTLASSYADEDLHGDQVLYDYAPAQREYENVGLKRVAALGRAVILFKQVKAKPRPEYMVFAPVVLAGFDDVARKVTLDLAAAAATEASGVPSLMPSSFSKAYAETTTKARLHQAHFRRATLHAYGNRCCVCELQERPLLDAAHILADRLPEGVAEVRNGLAMCPTHHRAYDQNVLLVAEDYRVRVQRERLTHAEAAPTVRMLVDYDGKMFWLPKDEKLRPEPQFFTKKMASAA